MELTTVQLAVGAFELALLAGGGVALGRLVLDPPVRRDWLLTNRLQPWVGHGTEVLLLALLMFLAGFCVQGAVQHAIPATASEGLRLFAVGLGFHAGALSGWIIYPRLRTHWIGEGAVVAPIPPHGRGETESRGVMMPAVVALAASFPLVNLGSLGWLWVLRQLGLPDEPQDLIGIFARVESPPVLAGLLVVACVLAPVTEELLFRRTLFRYLRHRVGRGFALAASSVVFASLHANWAGFLPLAVLGAVFAVAYEQTGDIRVPMLAHALFNLNTVIILVSGLES